MSNAFASAVFLFRNSEKVNKGDVGRAPAVVAQTGSLINKVSQLDSKIGETTRTLVNGIDKAPKIPFGSKALQTAGDLVNPLLVVASGVRVLTADDKEQAFFDEAGAMTGMFSAEALMKNEEMKKIVSKASTDLVQLGMKKLGKFIKPLGEAAKDSNNKYLKIASAILSGAAFVGASIVGYDAGKKVGHAALETKRKIVPKNPAEIDIEKYKMAKAESNIQANNTNRSLSIES